MPLQLVKGNPLIPADKSYRHEVEVKLVARKEAYHCMRQQHHRRELRSAHEDRIESLSKPRITPDVLEVHSSTPNARSRREREGKPEKTLEGKDLLPLTATASLRRQRDTFMIPLVEPRKSIVLKAVAAFEDDEEE